MLLKLTDHQSDLQKSMLLNKKKPPNNLEFEDILLYSSSSMDKKWTIPDLEINKECKSGSKRELETQLFKLMLRDTLLWHKKKVSPLSTMVIYHLPQVVML